MAYSKEIKEIYQKGFKKGYIEGRYIQKAMFKKKIKEKQEKIERMKREFSRNIRHCRDKQEKKYWYEELKKLFEYQKLLRGIEE